VIGPGAQGSVGSRYGGSRTGSPLLRQHGGHQRERAWQEDQPSMTLMARKTMLTEKA
jgi:hypothetical protein